MLNFKLKSNNSWLSYFQWSYSISMILREVLKVSLSGQKPASKRICFFLLRELRLDLEDLPFFETCFSALPSSIGVCWSGRAGGVSGHGVCFAGATTSNGGSIIHLNGSESLQSDMDVKFYWYSKIIWSSKKLLWSQLLDEMAPTIIFFLNRISITMTKSSHIPSFCHC